MGAPIAPTGELRGAGSTSTTRVWNTAAERGGKGLSPAYDGAAEPLLWECASGHHWKARPGNVRHGSWCPRCAFRTPGTIHAMRALATERGGACLSSEYLNDKEVLKWRCVKRHRFEYPALAVKSGAWCPTCRPPPRLREIHLPDRVAIERLEEGGPRRPEQGVCGGTRGDHARALRRGRGWTRRRVSCGQLSGRHHEADLALPERARVGGHALLGHGRLLPGAPTCAKSARQGRRPSPEVRGRAADRKAPRGRVPVDDLREQRHQVALAMLSRARVGVVGEPGRRGLLVRLAANERRSSERAAPGQALRDIAEKAREGSACRASTSTRTPRCGGNAARVTAGGRGAAYHVRRLEAPGVRGAWGCRAASLRASAGSPVTAEASASRSSTPDRAHRFCGNAAKATSGTRSRLMS